MQAVVRSLMLAWTRVGMVLTAMVMSSARPSADLAPPTGLAAVSSSSVVELAWDLPARDAGVTGYLIEAGSAPGQRDIGSAEVSCCSFEVRNVVPGTYYLRVRAIDRVGLSSPSNEVKVTTRAPIPPFSDALPYVDFNVAMTGSTAMLTWAPLPLVRGNEPPTSYIVQAGSWPGMNDLGEVDTPETRMTVRDVPDGVYYLQIRSRNASALSRVLITTGVLVVPSCTYVVKSVLRGALQRLGTTGFFTIATQPNCAWTVEMDRDWLDMSPTFGSRVQTLSGEGDGTVNYRAYGNNVGYFRMAIFKLRAANRELDLFIVQ